MQTILSIVVLAICLNVGVGTMAYAVGVEIDTPFVASLDQIVGMQKTTAEAVEDDGGFQAALIFGDWIRAAGMLIDFLSLGYLMAVVNVIAPIGSFPPVFVLGMQALFAVAVVFGLIYMISGRGTRQSD